MPTGYTAGVADGEITTLREFALRCARAFGAFGHMREESLEKPLRMPEVSDYHQKKIAETIAEIKRIEALTPSEIEEMYVAFYEQEQESRKAYNAKRKKLQERYEKMFGLVKSWNAPGGHLQLKTFMLEQLELCRDDYQEYDIYNSEKVPARKLHDKRLAGLRADLNYHTEEFKKEQQRVAEMKQWIEELLASLPGK